MNSHIRSIGGMPVRFFSIVFIIAGVIILGYGAYQWGYSYIKESQRVDEMSDRVSDEVISLKDTSEDENLIDPSLYDEFGEGDTIGLLYIPKLDRTIPIVEGTDEEELAQGVGHYTGTGFPGENKQILLSGHRDTVFRQFGELEDGDEFHIKMEHGTFIYEIRGTETVIVPANDTTVIDPNRTDEVLTVSTCYPFTFIGSAPDRYVVFAYPK